MDPVTLGMAKADASKKYAPMGGAAAALMSKLEAGKENASMVIFGDSTGDETNIANRWPRRTAQWLAAKYPQYTVNFRHWDKVNADLTPTGSYSALGAGKSEVIQTGTGTGNAGGPFVLDIWNGSASGSAPAYNLAASRWQVMAIPISPVPDLVFINHGHNAGGSSGAQFRYLLMQLTRSVQSLWPQAGIIVTAQNPMGVGVGDYALDLQRARAVISLAATEGYGLVNILQTYLNNPSYDAQWLNPADHLHPSDAGSVVWTNEVTKQLASSTSVVPQAPKAQRDSVWVPASQFAAFSTGMTAQPTLAVVNDQAQMWGFPAAQLSSVIADVSLPTHWTTFDAYLLWCVASTSGKTASTVVSWRLLRQTVMTPKAYPMGAGVQIPSAWVDPGVQSRNPSNGTAYQTVTSLIAQQSSALERVQAVRLQRNGNNGTDNIAETAYVRGVLFVQSS
ncbi:tail fiber protein [Arthrobacter phage Maja]|uniref:Esterase n=1 Tax=Arthrobacter phage Maja TaxID=2499009 RepID=A0A3S9UN09_9CAUD|nr:tail fiber protein [Arthrobacter phage Maja]AZS11724.1 esterase [Arthrobacter phage Maja]